MFDGTRLVCYRYYFLMSDRKLPRAVRCETFLTGVCVCVCAPLPSRVISTRATPRMMTVMGKGCEGTVRYESVGTLLGFVERAVDKSFLPRGQEGETYLEAFGLTYRR